MFGIIVGYLSWHAFRFENSSETIPIQKIASLIAVIGGAGILTLFPTGTRLFETYSLGLAIGFFFTFMKEQLIELYKYLLSKRNQRIIENQKLEDFEFQRIDENWFYISKLIKQKLKASTRIDDKNPRFTYINNTDLQELAYSSQTMKLIMKRFAHQNVQDDVEFRERNGIPTLFQKKW